MASGMNSLWAEKMRKGEKGLEAPARRSHTGYLRAGLVGHYPTAAVKGMS